MIQQFKVNMTFQSKQDFITMTKILVDWENGNLGYLPDPANLHYKQMPVNDKPFGVSTDYTSVPLHGIEKDMELGWDNPTLDVRDPKEWR
jgi:hypothetical protein|tara:strand:- start:79 stop:348 length:270 start_codon:yes stop_codon:yes gene_type:complete